MQFCPDLFPPDKTGKSHLLTEYAQDFPVSSDRKISQSKSSFLHLFRHRSTKMISRILCLFLITFSCFTHSLPASESYGAQHMIAALKKVLVKRPDASFAVKNPVKWHYLSRPILEESQREHDNFVKLMEAEGVEVFYHDADLGELADAIFVHDPVLITKQGALILRMGKDLRRGEEEAIEKKLHELGIPTYAKLQSPATAEGGDLLWLDENSLAVGQGFRTNREGFYQLKSFLEPLGVELIAVDLPYGDGVDACLHLQSLISLVDHKKAVVYRSLLPVSFVQLLEKRGYEFLDVPEEEFMSMGPNILAISPGVVLTIEGNPIIKKKMEDAGIRVLTYRGNEISLKAEGGATCLTRPLLRG